MTGGLKSTAIGKEAWKHRDPASEKEARKVLFGQRAC
jgi:hypothetical protein